MQKRRPVVKLHFRIIKNIGLYMMIHSLAIFTLSI